MKIRLGDDQCQSTVDDSWDESWSDQYKNQDLRPRYNQSISVSADIQASCESLDSRYDLNIQSSYNEKVQVKPDHANTQLPLQTQSIPSPVYVHIVNAYSEQHNVIPFYLLSLYLDLFKFITCSPMAIKCSEIMFWWQLTVVCSELQ